LAPTGKIIAVAAVAVAALLVIYTIYQSSSGPGSVTTGVPSGFSVNGRSYTFTFVATTPEERAKGLMNTSVTNATTELFAFPSAGEWQFWMYDTNTSLDMIWVNAAGNSGSVVYLATSTQPCYVSSECAVYTPSAPANYVIEAKAGFVFSNGIEVGTAIAFATG